MSKAAAFEAWSELTTVQRDFQAMKNGDSRRSSSTGLRAGQAKGELRTDPSHVIDIVPTLLGIAGVQKPQAWDGVPVPPAPGRSLVSAFAKSGAVKRDSLWWLHEENRALRVGDWKLVAAKGDPWELCDLSKDRGESQNLASEQPDRVREMEALWNRQTEKIRALASQDLPPGGAQPGVRKRKKEADSNSRVESGEQAVCGTFWFLRFFRRRDFPAKKRNRMGCVAVATGRFLRLCIFMSWLPCPARLDLAPPVTWC